MAMLNGNFELFGHFILYVIINGYIKEWDAIKYSIY